MSERPHGIRAGVRRLFRLAVRRPDIVRDDMDAEISFHVNERVEYFVARGMSRDEAIAEARRRLGDDYDSARERLHHSADQRERTMAMHERIEELAQDLRHAARGLARRPGFTVTAVLTLAIGIGANTAIFSAVNALMFRPLPFRNPGQLADVSFSAPARDGAPPVTGLPWSWMKYRTFRDAQQVFQDNALWQQGNFSLTGDDAERLSGEWAGAHYLSTLGVAPAIGHAFDPADDDGYDTRKVVLLSDDLWKRRFNADPVIVGKQISIERTPFEVIGVMPQGFKGLSGVAELFVPITTRTMADIGPTQAWSHEFKLVARLKNGVPLAQAVGAAPQWTKAIDAAWPDPDHEAPWDVRVASLDAGRVSPMVRQSLLVLFGAVGVVLLIACVNLASLLLGRATARRQEIAIRLALGAGRARLVRFLLAESALLAMLGGAASVGVALWGTRALAAANPAETLRVQNISGLGVTGFASIHLDVTALAFTLAISVIVGLLFGLVPALQATRPGLSHDMKTGHASHGRGLRWFTSRRSLVVTEVALAIVLLAGSGLMIRSLANLLGVNAGFEPKGVLSLRLTMPRGVVARDSLPGFYDRLLVELGALPGVTNVALGDSPPLGGGGNTTRINLNPPATDPSLAGTLPRIGVHWITPSWPATLGVPLKRGRLFNADDRFGGPKSILVSETAARKFWPGEDPIGKRAGIWQGGFQDGATVVGVIGDVRYRTVDSLPIADVYIPYAQSPEPRMMIFVRTSRGDPLTLVPAVRRIVSGLVPGLPVFDIQSMVTRSAVATAQARFSASLLALFAAAALALAAIGIYGVMSFLVLQRTREIGIRMALGAQQSQVLHGVIGEGLVLAGLGGAVGIAAAFAFTRVLGSMLFDVKPGDPATYAVIVLLLGIVALGASWPPARRAAKVEPTEALRAS
ncbi:MAG: ADOP family duplicated permease [Gemmatimonadaceae bacterium]